MAGVAWLRRGGGGIGGLPIRGEISMESPSPCPGELLGAAAAAPSAETEFSGVLLQLGPASGRGGASDESRGSDECLGQALPSAAMVLR